MRITVISGSADALGRCEAHCYGWKFAGRGNALKRFLLVVLAAVFVAACASLSALAHRSDAVRFVDPAGDSGGALDVTQISIDTDSTTGRVSFAVTVTGFDPSSMDGRTREIQIYLATDATLAAGRSDLAFIVAAGPQGLVPYVGHPTAPSWPYEPLPPTIGFSRSGDVLTWTFDRAEFGRADGFNFSMYTQIPDTVGGASHVADRAPDRIGRMWRYHYAESAPELVTPPQPVVVRPVLGSATTVPSKPVAGKRLVFTLAVKRSDSGAPLATGAMVCDPSVGPGRAETRRVVRERHRAPHSSFRRRPRASCSESRSRSRSADSRQRRSSGTG